MQEDTKPKSIRAHRKHQRKRIEGLKRTLLMRGKKCSQTVLSYLRAMRRLRPQLSELRTGGVEAHPFEATQGLTKMCSRREANLFVLGSQSKKRANNLVFGRLYEGQILDMAELGIISYQGVGEITDVPLAVRPFVVFQGDLWESDQQFSKLRNLLHDMFHANQRVGGIQITEAMRLLVVFSLLPSRRVHMNVYEVAVKGAGLQHQGIISLEELGPNVQLQLRRTKWADQELWKQATKVQKLKKKKEMKNVRYDAVGNKQGKLYIDKQNIGLIPTKKHKRIQKEKLKEKDQYV